MRTPVLMVSLACLALASPSVASASREASVPVGIENVNDSSLNRSDYRYGLRFVLDRPTTMYRMFNGWRLTGAACDQTGSGYGAGDGGEMEATLVRVSPDGRPDPASVLHRDRFNACSRLAATSAAYGTGPESVMLYLETGRVRLRGNTMYALLFRNRGSQPRRNFSGINSPVTSIETAGPQGVNELDPDAPGAIVGLDPRESITWSSDAGRTWQWGPAVGNYRGEGFDAVKVPFYGWQSKPGGPTDSNQPYYAYHNSGTGLSTTFSNPKRVLRLTDAGGFSAGADVGLVTVTNVATGQSATTHPLGGRGIRSGKLSSPVSVAPGQSYRVRAEGEVAVLEADRPLRQLFPFLGDPRGRFAATSDIADSDADVPQVFARSSILTSQRGPSRGLRLLTQVVPWLAPDPAID